MLKNDVRRTRSRTDSVVGLLTLVNVALFVFLGLGQLQPSKPTLSDAPLVEFSSDRAMRHLEAIAKRPHPVGSPEQTEVRDYILEELTAMGLEIQVQESTGLNLLWGSPFRAGTVRNIVARLKGTESTKSILLMVHYDSVPTGPGASDNGASVAAMLETVRALRAGSPLKNDLILLFTDGEEVGLLGAFAFVDEHPWARDVGLVVNLEARGIGGPSMMFETSAENGWLIEEFAKAVPHPVANSLAYEIYRLLPNDTDFTVFREAGFSGFNIAFFKGSVYYHTLLDNVENMDERSLQHQGSYTLALARHFGNLPLEDTKESNEVYFDIFSSMLVHYPGTWVIPLMILVVLLFIGVTALGFRKRRLAFSKIALGFLAFLVSVLAAPIIVMLTWKIIQALAGRHGSPPWGDAYNSDLYMIGFSALTVAITSLLCIWFREKVGVENLTIGGLLWWLVLTVLTSLCLPGSSYLFAWPLLFSLVGLGSTFVLQEQGSVPVKRLVILSVCAIPGIVLLAPMIYLIFVAMSLTMSGMVMVLVVLLMGLLIPHLDLMAIPNRWWLPVISALVSLGFVVAGSLTFGFDVDHPKANSIFYALNADTKEAVWVSVDQRLDEWTSQFISTDAKRDILPAFFPHYPRELLQAPAPTVQLPSPDMVLLGDSTSNNTRMLDVRITSPRQASSIRIYIISKTRVLRAIVNGRQIDCSALPAQAGIEQGSQWGLVYWAPPREGIKLTLEIEPTQTVEIRVVDQSYGFPEIPGQHYEPRAEHMISAPFPINSDLTLVSKTFIY
ncbi:MAG: M20/M25/M40 family metallo-hydrolase [Chloroflexi bacterium]|nr:M20/M25/M40 family metallo-hydrolase [Chloroflexota bacterium]